MTFTVNFHPAIEGDLLTAYSWYEHKSSSLGNYFLQTFYSKISLIIMNPLQYPNVFGEYRRSLLQKFPYVVYYLINSNLIIIMGLFHAVRDPVGIKSSLEIRKEE